MHSRSIEEDKTKETMSKAKPSEEVKGSSNRAGGLIYFQRPDGTAVVQATPHRRKTKFKRGRKEHLQRLQGAAHYARWAAKTQPIYAELANGTTRTAFNLARSDWFHPPVIHEMRLRENMIRVRASDNVLVTKVVITILDEEGRLLEAGEATRQEGDWWEYIPRTTGKILTAAAWDLPGNVTRFVL
jgi:hypothetical protein